MATKSGEAKRRSEGNNRKVTPDSAGAAEQTVPVTNVDTSKLSEQLNMLLGVAGATSQIVQQAASILEEEIAAGIVAAKRVEGRFVDVGKLRTGDPKEVMHRFRRDAHEVIDILVDLVNVATNSLGGLAQRVVTIRTGDSNGSEQSAKAGKPQSSAIPSLVLAQVIKPGQTVEIPMTLENESNNETETFHFLSSDLLNTAGERIAAQQISFTPAALLIGPHNTATVTVHVAVPAGTPTGIYSGLLQSSKLEQLRAVLTVRIE